MTTFRLLLALAVLLPAAATAAPRVVAVGDIHGARVELLELLEKAGIIDAGGRWAAGTDTLVQTGDLVDRGAEVRGVIELMMELQRQAASAGGRVVALMGNHEAMNLVREMRDFNPEAYAAFADANSEARRKRAYDEWRDFQRRRARRAGFGRPSFPREIRQQWMDAHPPGMLEYLETLGQAKEIGRWLRQLPVAAQVGDSVFLHGGISPEVADQELGELTRQVHQEIARFESLRQQLLAEEHPVILSWFTRAEMLTTIQEEIRFDLQGEPPRDPERAERLTGVLDELAQLATDSLSFGADGPLWFRGYSRWPDELLEPFLAGYLGGRQAQRIVVAHTPSTRGRIEQRLDGKVYLIDTGMLSSVYQGGRASALEIIGPTVREIYARALEEEPDEAAPAEPETEEAVGAAAFEAGADRRPGSLRAAEER